MRSYLGPSLLLLGCNQVFGLDSTLLVDGPVAAGCPAIGTVPAFSTQIRSLTSQSCNSYSSSKAAGRALAICGKMLVSGAIDDETLTPIPIMPSVTGDVFSNPSLFPEGDRLIVNQFDQFFVTVNSVYHREADGTWIYDFDLPFSTALGLGSVSAGPDRRMLILDTATATLHEWSSVDVLTWSELTDHAMAVTVPNPGAAQLSPDGLRLVMTGTTTVSQQHTFYYADRATRDATFNTPVMLNPRFFDSMQALPPPFLSEDCSRLYFTESNSIVYSIME